MQFLQNAGGWLEYEALEGIFELAQASAVVCHSPSAGPTRAALRVTRQHGDR